MKALLSIISVAVFITIGVSLVGFILDSKQIYLYQSAALEAEQFKPIIVPEGTPGIALEIKVDLSQQRIFTFEKGVLIRSFKISSGKIETPTPTGTFKVIHKQELLFSKIAGCWLSFWIGFTKDGKYGLHETPICDGTRLGEDKIGTPASAGCLRVKQAEAEILYNWAAIGTVVEIY